MTLTIHKEEDDQRQLKLTIEVAEQRVQQAMRQKARELAREVRIPGFRQGKAPYGVMVKRIGKEALRVEAVDDMFQGLFEEALAEAEVLPYAQPHMENMELDPLVLKFIVPLEPTVELAPYRDLRKEIEPVEISDEAVDEALAQVQIKHQNVEEVDRAIEEGDLVTISGSGKFLTPPLDTKEEVAEDVVADDEIATEDDLPEVAETAVADEETDADLDNTETASEDEHDSALDIIFNEESREFLMDSEILFPGVPFVDNLVGLEVGGDTEFTVTFPNDYEDEEYASREAVFSISILEVKERELPTLDDELAKLEGEYETLDELRESLAKNLEEQAENEAKQALIDGMIDDLLPEATMVFPPAAVESEIDTMLESLKQQISQIGWNFEDYLKIQSSSEADTRNDLRENAEIRLQRQLVLRQFVLDEKLTVTEEDIDAKLDERLGSYDSEELRNNLANYWRTGPGFDALSSEILMDKAYGRIHAIFSGEAPDLDELEAEAESMEEEE